MQMCNQSCCKQTTQPSFLYSVFFMSFQTLLSSFEQKGDVSLDDH